MGTSLDSQFVDVWATLVHFFEAEMRTSASAALHHLSIAAACGLKGEKRKGFVPSFPHAVASSSPPAVSVAFSPLLQFAQIPPFFLPPSFRPPLTHELLEASLPLLLCRLGQHYIIPPLFPPFLNPLLLPLREARDAAARGLSLWLEVLNSACVPKGDDVY